MARAVRTVAVLSCGSSEHAERLPSNADTTIWQVCLKCTLTFISSFTGTKKLTFLQFTWSQPRCSYCFDDVHRPRHETGSKTSLKFAFIPEDFWIVACSCYPWKHCITALINTLLPHWFQKIRQILLWKETYTTLVNPTAIVFVAWFEWYPSRP